MAERKEDVLRRMVGRLAQMASPQSRSIPITIDTEIYRDLNIYGDEIVDLVVWLSEEFGITGSINPFIHAPHEFAFFGLVRKIKRAVGIEPQYESLKVRDILAVIEAGHWPDEAAR